MPFASFFLLVFLSWEYYQETESFYLGKLISNERRVITPLFYD